MKTTVWYAMTAAMVGVLATAAYNTVTPAAPAIDEAEPPKEAKASTHGVHMVDLFRVPGNAITPSVQAKKDLTRPVTPAELAALKHQATRLAALSPTNLRSEKLLAPVAQRATLLPAKTENAEKKTAKKAELKTKAKTAAPEKNAKADAPKPVATKTEARKPAIKAGLPPKKADEKVTHLFSVGVCPPWKKAPGDDELTKKWAASCRNDVDLITDTLDKSLPAGKRHITKLIDEEADYEAVVTGLQKLATDAKPEDRVVIYVNTHGGELNAFYKGYPVKDEILAFYSEKEPANFQQATINGPWITTRSLRDLIDQIKAEEIVVIFESCHSAAGYHDFRYDLGGRYRNGWKGREAIIFSAGADQIANFVKGNDKALFTATFAEVLAGQEQRTLGDAFQSARIDTHRDIRKRCLNGPYADKMQLNHEAYLTYCTQQPVAFDPYGLLDDIKLQSRARSAMLK